MSGNVHVRFGGAGRGNLRLETATWRLVPTLLLPTGQDAAEAFYRVVDAAYEKRSLAVTSNLHPAGFDTIMPKTLATPTVDRLLHHAHLIVTEGPSLRLAEATEGKGVVPLA
jgi:IstB-like ATP binding protein